MSTELLLMTLDTAVTLRMMEMLTDPPEVVEALLANRDLHAQLADTIASKGDIIQFKSPKRGETAAAFNELARALALMAFVPGGVKFFGRHWFIEDRRAMCTLIPPPAGARAGGVESRP